MAWYAHVIASRPLPLIGWLLITTTNVLINQSTSSLSEGTFSLKHQKAADSYFCSLQTLYLKNLNPKVTEEDLVSLFARFQREEGPKIVFRLMKGRMKGQAFVTFEGKLTEISGDRLELIKV